MKHYNYGPKNRYELSFIVGKLIAERGNNANLNDIDTSAVKRMDALFNNFPDFNGDISEWDVSNVVDMQMMFMCSKFNGDISRWDVSNVKDMSFMFDTSEFNGDISMWDVGKVKNMDFMFAHSKFNGDISKWNINTKNVFYMFSKSKKEN